MRNEQSLSLAALAAAAFVALMPMPAAAQVQDRIVTIYGNDKCPASNGQEIVVCKRAPETERYRIPKDLRESEILPSSLGGQTVAAVNTTGQTAVQINSCSATGAGVAVGCLKKEADAWKADKDAQKKDEAGIP
jgi:hypothetical protein